MPSNKLSIACNEPPESSAAGSRRRQAPAPGSPDEEDGRIAAEQISSRIHKGRQENHLTE